MLFLRRASSNTFPQILHQAAPSILRLLEVRLLLQERLILQFSLLILDPVEHRIQVISVNCGGFTWILTSSIDVSP